jgi:AAA+ ATPase superfamily predicted ATPase
MKSFKFIGRRSELDRLGRIMAAKEASVITVYGRRRVGKTTLIEKAFSGPGLIKCEGIEGQNQDFQRDSMLEQFAQQANVPALRHATPDSWRAVLRMMTEYLIQGRKTLYLEEFQWLSAYKGELISEIKYFWDNYWRKNDNFTLILCGSSPSFMLSKVVKSKAMHNRSLHEFHIQPFTPREVYTFFDSKRSKSEALSALLLVGGIPEYLKYLKETSSVFLSMAQHSFTQTGFFSGEYERIFVSSLESNPHYKRVIAFLAGERNATRNEISARLGIVSGSNLTTVLRDLEICGFIRRYTPFDKKTTSLLARYEISDPYLQFYHRLIEPKLSDIQQGRYQSRPAKAFSVQQLEQWLGYGLERYCRNHAHLIAETLGFSDVDYQSGAFFSRGTATTDRGFQIDLMYKRADRVITLCEIRHNTNPISITDARKILESFSQYAPPARHSVQNVLICTGGVATRVSEAVLFDRVIDPLSFLF